MRAVRAHYEQELEEQFIRIAALAVTAEAVLGANLAELARPVGQDSRKAGIGQPRISGAATAVKASAHGPTAVHTIVDGGIQAEGALCLKTIDGGELITRAPDQLVSEENGVVDGAAQGFPAGRPRHRAWSGSWSRPHYGRARTMRRYRGSSIRSDPCKRASGRQR